MSRCIILVNSALNLKILRFNEIKIVRAKFSLSTVFPSVFHTCEFLMFL